MPSERKPTWRTKGKAHLQGLWLTVRAYPSTLVWPLLLFAALCGLGVWAATRAAQSTADSVKVKADFLARDAVLEYRQLMSVAMSQVQVLAALVAHEPVYDRVVHLFNATAPALHLVSAAAVLSLELVPSGVVRLVHPLRENEDSVGQDLFAIPGIADSVRSLVVNPRVSLVGPLAPLGGDKPGPSILMVRLPVFMPVTDANETFGRPDEPNPLCGPGCGFNATTGNKFWGLAVVRISLDALRPTPGANASSSSSPLTPLAALGFRYQLTAPVMAPQEGVVNREVVEASSTPPGGSSLDVRVQLADVQWTLTVGPTSGSWMPSWYPWVVAGVVVTSVLAALLLFGLLVSRRRHQMLLQTLLPSELIKDLQAEHVEVALEPRHLGPESPADLLLALLGCLLEGHPPDLRDVVLLRTVLRRHLDVYRPLNLGGRIREANLDTEVASALMRQLGDGADITTVGGTAGGAATAGLGAGWDAPPSGCKTSRTRGTTSSNGPIFGTGELLLDTHHRMEAVLALECQTMQGALAFLLYDKEADLAAVSTPGSLQRRTDAGDELLDESAFGSVVMATGRSSEGAAVSGAALPLPPDGLVPPVLAQGFTSGGGGIRASLSNGSVSGLNICVAQQQQQHQGARSRFGSGSGFALRLGSAVSGEVSARRMGSPLALTRCASVVPDPSAGGKTPPAAGALKLGGGSGAASFSGCDRLACRGGAPGESEPEAIVRTLGSAGAASAAVGAPVVIVAGGASVPCLPPAEPGGGSTSGMKSGGGSASGIVSHFSVTSLRNKTSWRRGAGQPRADAESPRLLLQGSLTAAAAAMAAARGCSASVCAGDVGCSSGGRGSTATGESVSLSTGGCYGTETDAIVIAVQAGNASAAAEAPLAPALVPALALPAPVRVVAPPRPVVEEVERLLSQCEGWQFDTWGLQAASGGHALSCMGFYLLQRTRLMERFRIEPLTLARLLRQIEAGYLESNPYHNAVHAADVLRTLHVLLHGAQLTAHYVDPLGLLACYFAAIVHDYGHPGLTNDFLIASSHPLALRYNDRSPLECHHAASAFTLLAERADLDVFGGLSRSDRSAFRKQVIEMVLATDMKQHFAILKHFTSLHQDRGGNGSSTSGQQPQSTFASHPPPPQASSCGPRAIASIEKASRPVRFHGGGSANGGAGHDGHGGGGDPSKQQPLPLRGSNQHPAPIPADEAERMLSLQVALKVADIGHLGAELERHKRWLGALEEEFFRQGDQERDLGLPISPLFDRSKQGVSKSQVGFYDFVALPLVRAVASAFPGAEPLLNCFQSNYQHWREVEEAAPAGPTSATQQPAQDTPAQQAQQLQAPPDPPGEGPPATATISVATTSTK